MDCSPPGSSVHGIFQARILEWVTISYSMGTSWSRDQTHISCISCIVRGILYHWATGKPVLGHNPQDLRHHTSFTGHCVFRAVTGLENQHQWCWKMCVSFLSYLEISAVLENPQGPEQCSEGFQICHYFQIRILKVQEVGGGWWDDTMYKIFSRYWSSPNQETNWTKVDAPGEQHPLFHSEDLKWWRRRTVASPESVALEWYKV